MALTQRSYQQRWIVAGLLCILGLFFILDGNLANDEKFIWYVLTPVAFISFAAFLILDLKTKR